VGYVRCIQRFRRRHGTCRWRSAARTSWICRGSVRTLTEDRQSSSTSSRSVTSLGLLLVLVVSACGWCVVRWRPVSCQFVLANCCKTTRICSECPLRTALVLDHPPRYSNLSSLGCRSVRQRSVSSPEEKRYSAAWLSGSRTPVFDRRTFPVPRSTCS